MSAPFTLPASWPMFRTLVGISVICAVLIVFVFQLTAAPIAQNQAEYLERAIVSIFPRMQKKVAYQQTDSGQFKSQESGPLYAVYDEQQELLGFAIKAQGMGYQDTIQLLYGYAPQQQALVGIKILSSRETPGLGDRIGKDPQFLRNFEQLALMLSDDNSRILHSIESVKAGKKTEAWQIDSISGATISSRAVADILRTSTERWVPALASQLEVF